MSGWKSPPSVQAGAAEETFSQHEILLLWLLFLWAKVEESRNECQYRVFYLKE